MISDICLPDSVTDIGTLAFFGCKSLANISIPDSVIKIGNDIFEKCNDLVVHVHKGSYAEEKMLADKMKIEYIYKYSSGNIRYDSITDNLSTFNFSFTAF